MTIIQKITALIRKKYNFLTIINSKVLRIRKFNPLIIISFLVVFSIIFFISSNLINKKNQQNIENIKEITKNNEFFIFKNFLISKISSPYQEIDYIIKNNDTVEKILKKFKIREKDIQNIIVMSNLFPA